MLRKKVVAPVAVPNIELWTEFWTASVATCKNKPKPRPIITIQIPNTRGEVVRSAWLNNHMPKAIIKVPNSGKNLYRPNFEIIRPETIEATTKPPTNGMVIRPDLVGE